MSFSQVYLRWVVPKGVVVIVVVVVVAVVVVSERVIIVIIILIVITVVVVIIIVVPKRVIVIVAIVVIIPIIVIVPRSTPTIFCHVSSFPTVMAVSVYLSVRPPVTLIGSSVLIVLLAPVILSRWVCFIGLV